MLDHIEPVENYRILRTMKRFVLQSAKRKFVNLNLTLYKAHFYVF